MDQPSNFIQTLFDFSFSEFVTTKIIKILYGIGILFAAFGALALIVSGFGDSFGKGLLFLIISPVIFIIYTIFARVLLETIIVMFRIAENVKEIADSKK
ncbi:DUF4282 domain-containing protein [candidate division KSB1 bacterium]|nr:DUF4282 domain-containing protein [candidate division KSB1 bacterium]